MSTENDQESSDDLCGDYEPTTVLRTSGNLDIHTNMEGGNETSVTVTPQKDCVGLRLSNEIGAIDVALLPEDIDELCDELEEAKEKTQEKDVKHTREWIVDEFRDHATVRQATEEER